MPGVVQAMIWGSCGFQLQKTVHYPVFVTMLTELCLELMVLPYLRTWQECRDSVSIEGMTR